MELFRAEYEAKLPKAWGKEIYLRLKAREEDSKNNFKAPRPHILEALKSVPTEKGPCDATELLTTLSPDDLCDFFMRLPHCQSLIMKDWNEIDNKVLRSISITMGKNLTELNFSNSKISATHLEILLANCKSLKKLHLSNCSTVDYACMLWFARAGGKTLTELYVDNCTKFKVEPMLAVCGAIGLNAPSMRRLQMLDLHGSPIEDAGLKHFPKFASHIRYMNLEKCSKITDKSFVLLAKAMKNLEVLNVGFCLNLSNDSIIALASSCPKLVSVNLNRLAKVNDHGIISLIHNCPSLQAMNLAGMRNLTENTLAEIALKLPGILMINFTGCGHISLRGLRALVEGLGFVEISQTFFGVKPVDEHVEKKLDANLDMIYDTAAKRITGLLHNNVVKKEMKQTFMLLKRDRSAAIIQEYMHRYTCRQHFYKQWYNKRIFYASSTIQRVWRGIWGRDKADLQKDVMHEFWKNAPCAVDIQRCFRGHKVRRRYFHVADALREMYQIRQVEAETALAVRFQSGARTYLTNKRVKAMIELRRRRGIDEYNAMVMLQCCGRMFNAKMRVWKKKMDLARYHEVRYAAATRIQHFQKAVMGKYKARQSRAEQGMAKRKRLKAAIDCQRYYRGHLSRQRIRRRKIKLAVRYFAAAQIQRIYRGSRIMYWRDMRINTIAAFVLDRQYLERRERIHASRERYKQFLLDNRKDSASEADDEDDVPVHDWVEHFDENSQRKYWVSQHYNQVTYDEPETVHAMENAMVNCRVKVYWVVQGVWYDGTVTRFNIRKMRHKIEYDDGDTEWINIEEEQDRIQVQEVDGSWTTYLLYQPPALKNEMRKATEKKERGDFKIQAHKEANQWEVIEAVNDDEAHMFISQETGEIRTGSASALKWVVQDDGHGFPCFYNTETEVIVYEDPRFVDNVSLDLKKQRQYVMGELRYAVYFCKELWEKYDDAVKTPDATGRKARFMAHMIRKSDKPRHMISFLLRARKLFKKSTVVDAPIDKGVEQEIEYATWLAERFAPIIEYSNEKALEARDMKLHITTKLRAKGESKVYCRTCKRETRRHLDFCPSCGAKQLDLIKEGSEDDPTLIKDSISVESNTDENAEVNIITNGLENYEEYKPSSNTGMVYDMSKTSDGDDQEDEDEDGASTNNDDVGTFDADEGSLQSGSASMVAGSEDGSNSKEGRRVTFNEVLDVQEAGSIVTDNNSLESGSVVNENEDEVEDDIGDEDDDEDDD